MKNLKERLDLLPGVRAKWLAIGCFWWSGLITSNIGISFVLLVKGSDADEELRPWIVEGLLILAAVALLVVGVFALDRYKRAVEDVNG